MLDAFLARFTAAGSEVTGVRIDVAEANRRSWRCLEKLGFQRDRSGVSIEGEPGPHYIYVRALGVTSADSNNAASSGL
jgi:RimJ/RimL family protein N-acetyltransferase